MLQEKVAICNKNFKIFIFSVLNDSTSGIVFWGNNLTPLFTMVLLLEMEENIGNPNVSHKKKLFTLQHY